MDADLVHATGPQQLPADVSAEDVDVLVAGGRQRRIEGALRLADERVDAALEDVVRLGVRDDESRSPQLEPWPITPQEAIERS